MVTEGIRSALLKCVCVCGAVWYRVEEGRLVVYCVWCNVGRVQEGDIEVRNSSVWVVCVADNSMWCG